MNKYKIGYLSTCGTAEETEYKGYLEGMLNYIKDKLEQGVRYVEIRVVKDKDVTHR